MKRISKSILFLLAIAIAVFLLYAIFDSSKQSPVFQQLVHVIPWAGYLHVVAGSIALILGGIQLSSTVEDATLPCIKGSARFMWPWS